MRIKLAGGTKRETVHFREGSEGIDILYDLRSRCLLSESICLLLWLTPEVGLTLSRLFAPL